LTAAFDISVLILIFDIPSSIANTKSSSVFPEPPCRTRGTEITFAISFK